MRRLIIAMIVFFTAVSCLFAEGTLYMQDNPQATTKMVNLTAQDIGSLEIKDNILIFNKKTDTLKGISGGDLLIAGACKEIPNGFIKRVVTIKEKSGKVIVETVEGSFQEMLNSRLIVPAAPDGKK